MSHVSFRSASAGIPQRIGSVDDMLGYRSHTPVGTSSSGLSGPGGGGGGSQLGLNLGSGGSNPPSRTSGSLEDVRLYDPSMMQNQNNRTTTNSNNNNNAMGGSGGQWTNNNNNNNNNNMLQQQQRQGLGLGLTQRGPGLAPGQGLTGNNNNNNNNNSNNSNMNSTIAREISQSQFLQRQGTPMGKKTEVDYTLLLILNGCFFELIFHLMYSVDVL